MANFNQALFNNPYTRVAFGSITGSFTTIDTITDWNAGSAQSGSVAVIMIQNSLNQDVILSFDGGTTESLYLSSTTTGLVIDLAASNMIFQGVIQIKHAGAAPGSGALVLNTIGVRI